MLFPASNFIIKLAKKISRVGNETDHKVLLSLDDRMLQTPSFAIQATISEVGHMGEVVKNALEIAERVLFTKSKEDVLKLREYEEQVDELCGGITEYVIKITKLQISQKEHEFLARLLQELYF